MSDGLLQATSANDIYHNVSIEKFADSKLPENLNKSRDQNVLPGKNKRDCYEVNVKCVLQCT